MGKKKNQVRPPGLAPIRKRDLASEARIQFKNSTAFQKAHQLRKRHNSGWRRLAPFGLFAKAERLHRDKDPMTLDGEPLSTFASKWRYMRPITRIIYLVYILPFLFTLFALALALFLPWRFLRFTRPNKVRYSNKEISKIRLKYEDHAEAEKRDILAPIGFGHYHMNKSKYGKQGAQWEISRIKSLVLRVWDMHCLQRDCWAIFHRQGMQVAGVLCGATLAIMEIIKLTMEFRGDAFAKFLDAKATGGDMAFLKILPGCAYVPGTGFANWGSGYETFGWYTLYHGWVLLLCFMLIADELLNVRMGLFAPQNTRAGTGYTIIFLALCLLNSSPNWGWKRLIPIHQDILTCILFYGVYLVLRCIMDTFDCTDSQSMSRDNRRNGRFPLRPWTTAQWKNAYKNGNFRQNQSQLATLRQAERIAHTTSGARLTQAQSNVFTLAEAAQEHLDKLYPMEKLQALVGDHAFELQDRQMSDLRKEWETFKPGQARDGFLTMKEEKPRDEKMRERGRFGRRWIHGWTLRPMNWTSEDHYLIARSKDSQYLVEIYESDRFLVYTGSRPLQFEIANEQRWLYADNISTHDIFQPTDKEWESGRIDDPKNFRWENESEFKNRQERNKKEMGLDYFGNHNWNSPHTRHNGWYRWFDIRRGICVSFAILTFLIHVAFLIYNIGAGTSNFPMYNAQYTESAKNWRANGGPSMDECQYYEGTAMPIWIRPGAIPRVGVVLTEIVFISWEIFIMNLCLGVILVGLSNNRAYGMHLPYPITLIGPRLSSVSLGWTIGFLGTATLQLGLFHFQSSLQWAAQFIGYGCIATSILFLFRNEEMLNTVTRRPCPPILSFWAHEYMDGKLVYKRSRDAEYD